MQAKKKIGITCRKVRYSSIMFSNNKKPMMLYKVIRLVSVAIFELIWICVGSKMVKS